MLDEDGHLALATVSPQGLQVLAKTALLRHNAWTAPALAGTRLYLRDRHTLMALELPAEPRPKGIGAERGQFVPRDGC